ncbi:GGDEF domain-containing protein, partial [Micromonospora sp. SL1-18]
APVRLPSGAVVSVTASIGLAPTNPAGLAATLADADAAMYRAKTTRTGVALFDPRRDDHTTPTAAPRPALRVRDLASVEVGR